MIEVVTKISYRDPSDNKRKSYFEVLYATVIKVIDKSLKKDELERIILCEVQNEIYPELEKIFLGIIKVFLVFLDIKFEKKIDFEQAYIIKDSIRK